MKFLPVIAILLVIAWILGKFLLAITGLMFHLLWIIAVLIFLIWLVIKLKR